jgi:urease accessory protein
MTNFTILIRFMSLFYIVLDSTVAFAHPGHGVGGLLHGFFHPIHGLDHLLTALAIGVWAAETGKRALFLFPAAFIAAMIFGGILGFTGYPLPLQEMGILLSVVFLGFALLTAVKTRISLSAAVIASFGVFHGNAHGTEIIQGVSSANYCMGFVLATVLLHLSGIVFVLLLKKYFKASEVLFAIRAFGSAVLVSAAFLGFHVF